MASRKEPSRAQALFDAHYEFHARYHGDENAKKAAAEARRVATSLGKSITQFTALLDPKQLQALQDASTVMRGLAADLDVVCKLANAHKADTARKRLQEWQALCDQVAAERWAGDDAAMLVEARELSDFWDQADALEVDEWIKSRQPGARYAQFPDRDSGEGERAKELSRLLSSKPLDTLAVRRHAAFYLHALRDAMRRSRRYNELYYVGLDDFEAWRAWRKEIAGKIMPARNAG